MRKDRGFINSCKRNKDEVSIHPKFKMIINQEQKMPLTQQKKVPEKIGHLLTLCNMQVDYSAAT